MANKKENKTGFWALLTKFGFKLLPWITKLLKATKFLKIGLALASFGVYAFMFTWKFALLIMIALAWHESGHVWAMRKIGIKTKGFYFIPFLGGAAIAEEKAKTYASWSFVALMGPVWGLGLALATCVLYYATNNPMFAAAAGWMGFLNLFNLFPVVPLDGGQVVRSIAFSIHKRFGFAFLCVSLLLCSILAFKMQAGLFAFLLFIGIADLIAEHFNRNKSDEQYERRIGNADEYRMLQVKLEGKGYPEQQEFYMEKEKYWRDLAEKDKKTIPTSMNRNQIITSIAAYAGIVIALIVIVKLMGAVPGGNLAAEFLADK